MFMSNHPHALFLQRLYGNDDEARALLAASTDATFICHGVGRSPVGGEFVGLPAMQDHLAHLWQRSGGTLEFRPIAFYADDLWGLVSQTMTATRNGRSLNICAAGIWRFSGPNRLAEHWECVSDSTEWNTFWSV